MNPQNGNEARESQRESQIVRDALRHLPYLESSPDFEHRVLDAIRDASVQSSTQHVWISRTPTRRERTKLWFVQNALKIEKLFSIAPKVFTLLCAAVFAVLLIIVLQFTWSRALKIDNINSPMQVQAGDVLVHPK